MLACDGGNPVTTYNYQFHKWFDSLKEPDRFCTFISILMVGIWSSLSLYYLDFISNHAASVFIMLFPVPLLVSRLFYLNKFNKLGETNAPT